MRKTRPMMIRWSPQSRAPWRSHSRFATQPERIAQPLDQRSKSTFDHWLGLARENRRERWDWPPESTLMAKCLAMAKVGQENAARSRLQSTSGGSSDTELNELAVMPTSRP